MARLVEDESTAVRREVAVSLRHVEAGKKRDWVVSLLAQLPRGDRTYLEACGLAAETAEVEIWAALKSKVGSEEAAKWSDEFAWITWRLQPEAAIPALVDRAQNETLSEDQRNLAIDTLAFTRSQSSADAMAELAANDNLAAKRWLLTRAWGEWESFGMQKKLKEVGLYDPDNVTISPMPMPMPKGESNLPPIAEIVRLKGNAKTGKAQAARCYTCHKIEGNGIAYGPDLRKWVADQGLEAFYRAVIDPAAEIAHGFNGTSVKLRDDKGYIHGLAISRQDPVVIQSMGGVTQIIPKSKVEKVSNFKGSLMLSADQLGMTAQDLADLAAYLRTVN
jgi:putative heme-binding domain-containing protein